MKTYDVVVIGSGSGLEISAQAAQRGMSVAVVEEGPFGGTCLNRGCIPSKMLIHCADVAETIQRAHLFGIKARVESVDWPSIMARVYEEIDRDAQAVEEGNRQVPNIDVYKGTGRFVGEKALEVDGQRLAGETVVIAAGTRPSIPEIPGLAGTPYLTSDEALRLPQQPARLAIVGGGYIAAELAHFFGALGTEVTIIHRRAVLLRDEDQEVARRFTEVYRRRFNMLTEARVSSASYNGSEVSLQVATPDGTSSLTVDGLLLATGRVPNTDILEVGKTGVEVDERGFVANGRVPGNRRGRSLGPGGHRGPVPPEAQRQPGGGLRRQQHLEPPSQGARGLSRHAPRNLRIAPGRRGGPYRGGGRGRRRGSRLRHLRLL